MKGRRSEKLTERFVGPYKVKGIVSSNTIELELPKSIKIVKDEIWENKRGRIIDKNYNLGRSKVLHWREVLLIDSTKRTLADSQERWNRERLIERPWL